MLAGEASRLGAAKVLLDGLEELDNAVRLVTSILAHLDVNRSLFDTRTNRGFSTSSELAELLATDFKLPANQAFEIAERVVIEALQAAIDATTLRTDLVDRVALQVLGREVGIEPELLSRCLAPKRFIERRDVLGGPAPAAVSAQLDREVFAIRLDRDWAASARSRIGTAREALQSRARDVAGVSTATEAE
jgi:argininosuccinate lyase